MECATLRPESHSKAKKRGRNQKGETSRRTFNHQFSLDKNPSVGADSNLSHAWLSL